MHGTEGSMRTTTVQWVHALIITGSVILTYVIGIFGPFNNGNFAGQETTELFLPAGYAFAIWAVIYLGLFGLGIWQGLSGQAKSLPARRAAPWLSATALGNLMWIVAAGSVTMVPLTLPIAIFMMVTGWAAYYRLPVGNPGLPAVERWLHVALRIYLGWLSVAVIANSATVLNGLGWDGWGVSPEAWTVIMLAAGAVVAWEVGRRVNHDNVYRGVFVWAFVAIFAGQRAYPVVAWSALAAAAAVSAMILATLPRRRGGRQMTAA